MKVSSEVFYSKVRPALKPYGLQITELNKLAVYVKAFELALKNHFNSNYHIDEIQIAISTMVELRSAKVKSLDPEIKGMLKPVDLKKDCREVLISLVNETNQSAKSYIYIQNQLLQLTC